MNQENALGYEELKAALITEYENQYGTKPLWFVAAPARVNLIGEHIDYCDGFVLPLAIDRHVMMAASPNGTDEALFTSLMLPDQPAVIPLDERPKIGSPSWANIIRGVFYGFYQKDIWPIPGFDTLVHSNVPLGAGLSSSAALGVAAATMIESVSGLQIQPKNKGLLCQAAEHQFAGVPCGIMDQFASIFGKKDHMVLIDCRSEEAQAVPFTDDSVTVIIANTCVAHELSDGSYANRRKQTEIALSVLGKDSWREVTMDDLLAKQSAMSEQVFRKARHVVTEIDRTQQAALALSRGETETVGELMAASHRSLRDDFEVSCEELDIMVQAAWDIGPAGGVLGSRMTGGGFGGSTVTLARKDDAQQIIATMASVYQEKTGIEPEIFATTAVDGAHAVDA
ncbi:galactokinase [Verrucomicrobiaceae bacterium 5K15]|uniref:Galactokinase n=1 Tax=Oceaniferula flava TaxID=2800421 RepID=A0AAE2VCG9_9BACT|nr:galactokinase [Oceaniferula flavus]MBK1855660.1 galactokinase [Oceaniferula flavus]MBM1136966.1 galactokinase [Oceaniferula flavus]